MEKSDIHPRNDGLPLSGQVPSPTVNENEPPDGGYGWVCTAAAAVVNAHSWGFNSAYAVFLAHFLKHNSFPGSTPLNYAFVGSLSLTFLLLVSPLATILVREIGIRPTMFCGVVLETASLLCASLATEIWHLFLTQGVVFGLGLGLLFIPTAAVVPQWFTTKRSLASGVSLSGAGLGGLVYSLATAAMIRNLGLQYAFRILGILAFVVNTSCILLIKDRNKTTGSNQNAFDTSLLKRWEYLLLLGFACFTMLGYFILIFTLANYANEIGLNASQGAVISALFNGGQAVGRPLIGYFSDSMGRMNMAGSMTFLAGVLSLAVWINAKSYGMLIFYAISEGLVAGNFWATIAPLMAEVVGIKRVPSGLNILWLSIVLPSTFSEPIALEICMGTGSYFGTQLFTGLVYIAAAICIGLLRGYVDALGAGA
ncbi:monocarboxylate transporter [Thelonectria olida]|uniref:Monocarboxylate transporter n=1 Tax=Thelonectria olida TaxID=1576542 RepID=A0A9P8W7E6_9HYPO|nr:monocarboxylate transporter [Thelonectria olida]